MISSTLLRGPVTTHLRPSSCRPRSSAPSPAPRPPQPPNATHPAANLPPAVEVPDFHDLSEFQISAEEVDMDAVWGALDKDSLAELSPALGLSTGCSDLEESCGSGQAPLNLRYGTVMLKLSGEALSGERESGVDPEIMNWIAEEIAAVAALGVKVAVVVGGGNYFRGATAAHKGLERATADYVGMLATVMNALQLQAALEYLGVPARVQTAIEMREVAEPYIRRRAVAHLNAGRVVIFGAGTGNPFFTTDTAAALRAAEINADLFVKCTKVDGIFDSDPAKNPSAVKYDQLSYRQCTDDSLAVMDETAITLCKENKMPVMVLNMLEQGNIMRALMGENVGTIVS